MNRIIGCCSRFQFGKYGAHIELYCRREDRKTCIWVWLDDEMRRTNWGQGDKTVVEVGKKYLTDIGYYKQ
jgi:hypothetical protein